MSPAAQADHEVAAVPADALRSAGLGERAADRIVDDVDARGRERLHALLEVARRVVDRLAGAVLATERELVIGARGGDHARAELGAEPRRRRCRRLFSAAPSTSSDSALRLDRRYAIDGKRVANTWSRYVSSVAAPISNDTASGSATTVTSGTLIRSAYAPCSTVSGDAGRRPSRASRGRRPSR